VGACIARQITVYTDNKNLILSSLMLCFWRYKALLYPYTTQFLFKLFTFDYHKNKSQFNS